LDKCLLSTRPLKEQAHLQNVNFMPQLALFLVLKPHLVNNFDGDVDTFLTVLSAVHDAELPGAENFVGKNLINLFQKNKTKPFDLNEWRS